MRQLILGSCALLALTLAVPAFAAPAEDAAWDKHSQPVGDSYGKCVRTKWQDASDPCAVNPPAPKPVAVAPAPLPVPVVALEQRTIYFDFDKAVLTPEAHAKLDNLARIINSSMGISDVRIHGFTDQFGSNSYNKALSDKRAAAVKSYLDSKSRLQSTVADVEGLGKSVPAEGCKSIKKRDERISCMAQERRVEVELKAQVR